MMHRLRLRGLVGPVVKSLIFIVVTSLATAVLAISIANTGTGDTVGYYARFADVTGLAGGDSVRIAGVKVGQVESIKVVDHRVARVRFSVERKRHLPASVTASVKYLNLVGQRYLELDRGTGPVDRDLAPGSTIPLDRTAPALDLTELFNGFQPLFQGLAPQDLNKLSWEIVQVLQGEGGTVDGLLSDVGSLTSTLAARDKVVGQVIDNLNTVLTSVNSRQQGFTDLVVTLQQLVSGFSGDRKPLGDAITAMSQLTTTTADLFQRGRAPLRSSIAQLGRLSSNLAANTPAIEDFLHKTPLKMQAIGRIASYGSWLNFYLCEAKVSGVTTSDGSPPPTGIPVTAARCRS